MLQNNEDFRLSDEERLIVGDSDWIMTKLRIIQKVYALFGALSVQFASILSHYGDAADDEVYAISPKIYKGESYRLLPYVMMDQPRFFKQEDVFAIRCFFWWGNSFSIHLLLGGKYKQRFQQQLTDRIKNGVLDNWFAGVNNDPWQHHFEQDNYLPIESNAALIIANMNHTNYIKLARTHPFTDWEGTHGFYLDTYTFLMQLMAASEQDH